MPSPAVTIAAIIIVIFLASALTKIYPQISTSNQIIEGSIVSNTQYTSLEQDALVINKTGVAGMDWFVHNRLALSASHSGPLTPIPVDDQERNWVVVDGSVGLGGNVRSLPNLKRVYLPQGQYVWIDANGDVKAKMGIGYAMGSTGTHFVTSTAVIKLTTEGINFFLDGKKLGSLPASTANPQDGQVGSDQFPLDWGYTGGWSAPSNDIRGSPAGPLGNAAANLQVIEHQIAPYSENYTGDFTLKNFFAYGNSNSQVYIFTVMLPHNARCVDAGCELYADTHGTVKLTLNADGTISYFLVDGPRIGWTVKYGSTVIHEFPSPSCLQDSCLNPNNAIIGLLPSQTTTTTIPGATTTTISTTSTTQSATTTTIPVTSTTITSTTATFATLITTTTINSGTTTTPQTASSTTTTTITPPAQPCKTYDIPCWIGYFILRIFGLMK
jgi:hypothetical protein